MKAITTTSILASALFLTACVNYHIRKGNLYYENTAYSQAIEQYEKVVHRSDDMQVNLRLADSYSKINRPDSAEAIYSRIIKRGGYYPEINFHYGRMLMENGHYRLAINFFNKYLEHFPKDQYVKMLLSSCNAIGDRYRDTTLFVLKPIATDGFENAFGMVGYKKGVVFTADMASNSDRNASAWTGNTYLDLYFMDRDEKGNWLSPEPLPGDINGPLHEGPATFSDDGMTVYFTRSNYFRGKMKVNDKNENNLKLYKASLIDGKWKSLEEFPFNSDDYSVGHASLTKDGNTIYFISDMPGGFGGTDIYKCSLVKNTWSRPENLGPAINTKGNEMFPYIHSDGALYFSSDAFNSMGGLDVFVSDFDGKTWSTPENLNYPLNSAKDDFGFRLNEDNKTGFVSSSRAMGDNGYTFEKMPPTFNFHGRYLDKKTLEPVEGGDIVVIDMNTGEGTPFISDTNGAFGLKLSPGTPYAIYFSKQGYFSREDAASTVGLKYSENMNADFIVEPIAVDTRVVLENVYYDYDKWNIRPDAALELDKLVKFLKDNPAIDVELSSFTDARGTDRYNMRLSEKRAKSVVSYLIANDIDPKRLTYKGYGERVPVNSCKDGVQCSEEQHQANRRTEFKVIAIH